MSRLKKTMVGYVLALVGLLLIGLPAALAQKTVVDEDFNGLTEREVHANSPEQAEGLYGWELSAKATTTGSTSIVKDPDDPDNLVLKHSLSGGGVPFRAIKSFPVLNSGEATIEFKIRRAGNPAFLFTIYDENEIEATWMTFQANGGNFGLVSRYAEDSSMTNLFFPDESAPRISPNEWYSIRYELDITNSKAKIYVDGQQMSSSKFPDGELPIRPNTRIAKVAISLNVANPNTVYLDDLLIQDVTLPAQPEASGVEITGPDTIEVPESADRPETAQYSAVVLDQYGAPMPGETVRWSLRDVVHGVAIDETSGLVTVDHSVEVDQFIIRAVHDPDGKHIAGELAVSLKYKDAAEWPADSMLVPTEIGYEQVMLSWNGIPNTADYDITDYAISLVSGLDRTVVGSVYTVTDNVYTSLITGLIPGTTYTFKVEAYNSNHKWSTTGPAATLTTRIDNDPPQWTADKFLHATNLQYTGLRLDWSQDAADDSGISGYVVKMGEAIIATTADGHIHSHEVVNLTPGSTYTFTVEAIDSFGNVSEDGPSVLVVIPSDFATDIRFQVGTDHDARTLVGGQRLSAYATMSNQQLFTEHVRLIVALYDEQGTMVDVATVTASIAPLAMQHLETGFELPSDVNGYTVRAMVWDESNSMVPTWKPLAAAAIIPENQGQ